MPKIEKTLVGSHISTAGGLHKAFERGQSIGCSAMQIFTKSNRQWFEKNITDKEAELFKQTAKESTIKSVIVHAGYLINIGSSKKLTAAQSTKSLLGEVHRCQQLDLKYLVFHPGAHLGAGIDQCIEQVAANLDFVIENSDSSVTILIETMAGQGTTIGNAFEELARIRSLCKHKRKVAFCLDTCHIFSAGYDISTEDGYKQTLKTFDTAIGLEHLKAIHINDSQTKLSSHVDRHAPLGEGSIPLKTFQLLMNDKRLVDVPKILETPSDPEMKLWAKEIKLLKSMIE